MVEGSRVRKFVNFFIELAATGGTILPLISRAKKERKSPDVKWGARLTDFVKTDTMTFAANIHSQ